MSILVGTARERNGPATRSHLSGMGCAPNLSRMHGPDAILGLFPPTAIGAGVEMGHQSIQHIKHAFRKHRTLALLALTHLVLQFFAGVKHIRSRPDISSLADKFFAFFLGKKDQSAFQGLGLSEADLNMWDRCLRRYTAGVVNALGDGAPGFSRSHCTYCEMPSSNGVNAASYPAFLALLISAWVKY